MSSGDLDYLKYFGEIKFAEEKSMSASDFERVFNKHLNQLDKLPHGSYKFGEINNSYMDDFIKSFNEYFG
ncbi:MAG: hypothetical protein ACTSRH_01620 [Promethearchaeota archaeon]